MKNTAALQHSLEQDGLIKSRAELLAAYSQTQSEAASLAHNNAFFELVSELRALCQGFSDSLQSGISAGFASGKAG